VARDIIDAEFETIRRDDGRHPVRDVPSAAPSPTPEQNNAPTDQIGILKQASVADEMPGRRAQLLYVLSVLFSALFAFYVSGGHVLFHAVSARADTGPLALELSPTASGTPRQAANVDTVSATISNPTHTDRTVPDVLLTFSSRSGDANLIYRVPRGEMLAPGKSLAFTVRMPKKPGYDQAPSLTFDTNGV
jgi:hypothetical protein